MFGLCLPESYGGRNENTRLLAGAIRTLVAASGNAGVAMTWLIHEIISYCLIFRFADDHQKNELLPDLAAGKITVSLAVSEPEIGAHPKHLKTEAYPENGLWHLNGKKCHITNGPMADWFIILAKTGKSERKNLFTAFLVHKDTKGLTVSEPAVLPFLRPCPHASISLEDCRINGCRIIGPPDNAFSEMAIPFRRIEDVLMMSLINGAIHSELNWLGKIAGHPSKPPNNKVLNELGHLKCSADAMGALADRAADLLDNKPDSRELTTLPLFLRAQAGEFQRRFKELTANLRGELSPDELPIARDIDGLLGIGRTIAQSRIIQTAKQLLMPG